MTQHNTGVRDWAGRRQTAVITFRPVRSVVSAETLGRRQGGAVDTQSRVVPVCFIHELLERRKLCFAAMRCISEHKPCILRPASDHSPHPSIGAWTARDEGRAGLRRAQRAGMRPTPRREIAASWEACGRRTLLPAGRAGGRFAFAALSSQRCQCGNPTVWVA